MIARAGALLAMAALAGGTSACAPAKGSAPRPPPAWSGAWSPGQGAGLPHASPSAPQPPNPYLPLGETKDPWWSPSGGPGTVPPRAAGSLSEGPFLILLGWGGARADERAPEVHATLARLGGVRRAATLWEVAPQPGGGLGPIASALERELCAEDVVVVWRARGAGLERSEFAGHRACPAPAAPPSSPSPSARGASNPARPIPPGPAPSRPTPPGPTPRPADPFDARF